MTLSQKYISQQLLIFITFFTILNPILVHTKPQTKTITQATYDVGKLIYNASKLYMIKILLSRAIIRNFDVIRRNGVCGPDGVQEFIFCASAYALAESIYYSYKPAIRNTFTFFNNHYRHSIKPSCIQKNITKQEACSQKTANQTHHHTNNQTANGESNYMSEHTTNHIPDQASNYTAGQLVEYRTEQNIPTCAFNKAITVSNASEQNEYAQDINKI